MEKYAKDWLLGIEDISEFVEQQRQALRARKFGELVTPSETTYVVADAAVAERLELDHGRA